LKLKLNGHLLFALKLREIEEKIEFTWGPEVGVKLFVLLLHWKSATGDFEKQFSPPHTPVETLIGVAVGASVNVRNAKSNIDAK